MKALVTGASGFVGQYLVKHLFDSGDQVFACHNIGEDTLKTPLLVAHPKHDFVIKNATWMPLSVTDRSSCLDVIDKVKPQVIYHLAGIAFVPEAEANFERALSINVAGTYNLYAACEQLELPVTIVLVSSAEVYGRIRPEELPVSESVQLRPANNYSLTKVMAEYVANRYSASKYIKSVIMRPFNHIGAGQNERFVAPNFARQLAEISKANKAPVLRVGNLESKRDFTDVLDIVRAYRLGALKGSGVYNLGSGNAVSIATILHTLIEVSELRVTLEPDPERMRASEVPEVRADITKAFKELGWKPEVDLRETLMKVYQHAVEAKL
jgi:GDP-4-dehydro-6-deoxy-D-mannose reductase